MNDQDIVGSNFALGEDCLKILGSANALPMRESKEFVHIAFCVRMNSMVKPCGTLGRSLLQTSPHGRGDGPIWKRQVVYPVPCAAARCPVGLVIKKFSLTACQKTMPIACIAIGIVLQGSWLSQA